MGNIGGSSVHCVQKIAQPAALNSNNEESLFQKMMEADASSDEKKHVNNSFKCKYGKS